MTDLQHDAHFVFISRFNLPHPAWETRSAEAYRDWIANRLKLFSEFTVPSVRNTHGKFDRWLILIDTRVVDIKSDLLEMTKGLPVQIVEYTGHTLVRMIQIALEDLSFPSCVMTCRLDTDDLVGAGIVPGYRAAKVTEKEVQDGIVLSFPGGAIYASDEDRFYYTSYPENPFLCYVEKKNRAEDLHTVYQAMHVDMLDVVSHAKMLRSFGPLWASVVHGENVANQSLMGAARFSFAETKQLKKFFGVKKIKDNLK